MSSPPESLTDIEESALNKKRGRAQSAEPTPTQEIDDVLNSSQEASASTVSAPKKTKRDDEDNTATVSTIRKNMKDMSTTDKNLTETSSTVTSEGDDEPMGTIVEEDSTLAKFGGNKDDDDDWGEFADEEEEEEEEVKTKPVAQQQEETKPKYTFGASSGFGTKGWATHQTIPTPSKQPTFSGFGSSSLGFGGFKTTMTESNNSSATSSTASAPSNFGAFAKATSSPFATATAALTSPKVKSPTSDSKEENADSDQGSENEDETTVTTTFGEGAKVKVPGVKQQTEIKTGEEDEDTIYQTKAKLLVLDTASNNWKERGVGTFRINMKEEQNQTRLVMRTDSVYRLILNLLLFEGMKVVIMQDKFVRFAGFETETKEDGQVETKMVSYALKLSNPSVARDVCDRITSCIPKSTC